MATAKGPLFSLQASGSIGGALTYTKDGREWIVTWALKVPSDGGQVFITVKNSE